MQPNAEMSYCHVGFDLKAAREICIKLDLRYPARSLVDIDYQCALAAEMLPAALDEVERLQKALALKTEQHKGQADVIGSYLGMLTDFNELNESQTKRIAELKGKLKTATQYDDLHIEKYNHAMRKISKLHAALKKLGQAKRERGKALVEERAISIVASLGASWEDLYEYIDDGELRSQNGYRKMAREQLRREGKL